MTDAYLCVFVVCGGQRIFYSSVLASFYSRACSSFPSFFSVQWRTVYSITVLLQVLFNTLSIHSHVVGYLLRGGDRGQKACSQRREV